MRNHRIKSYVFVLIFLLLGSWLAYRLRLLKQAPKNLLVMYRSPIPKSFVPESHLLFGTTFGVGFKSHSCPAAFSLLCEFRMNNFYPNRKGARVEVEVFPIKNNCKYCQMNFTKFCKFFFESYCGLLSSYISNFDPNVVLTTKFFSHRIFIFRLYWRLY